MQIIDVEVSKLIPYAKNSRTHSDAQVAQIAASIKEFGWTNPILVDGENGIIAGHGRLMAARKLKYETVPVIELKGMTPSQKKAYIIADNQLAMNSGWDTGLLSIELNELKDEDFDLSLLGFDDKELDKLLEPEVVEGLTDEDAVPDAPEEPKTKPGDIYILGNHRLMCGDSTSIDAVEKLMDGQKADMVFTDPPYGVDYDGGHATEKRRTKLENDDKTLMYAGALPIAFMVSKDGAALYVWYASGKSVETYASLSKLPLKLRAVIQWYKVKSGLGAFMSQYIPNCEPCMYLHKDGCSPAWYGPSNEKTVWELKKEPKNDYHPTQKPVELMEYLIKTYSNEGDTVLDN